MSAHPAPEEFEDIPPPSYQEAISSGTSSITNNLNHQTPGQAPIGPQLPPRKDTNYTPVSPFPGFPQTTGAASRPPAQSFQTLLPQVQPQNHGSPYRQFPPAFNLYRSSWPDRAYHLGEHQDTPLYTVIPHSGWGPSADLVLHNGHGEHTPVLAALTYDSWSRRVDVTLPPLPGTSGGQPATISVTTPSVMKMTFAFSIKVPITNTAGVKVWRRESFEWRRSHGLAVHGLVGQATGWKLVRLSDELPPGGLLVGGSGVPSGDGHEVVAVCTNAVMSMTKIWKFAFLGSGVTGILGERWAAMAVITGLAIWDHDRRRN